MLTGVMGCVLIVAVNVISVVCTEGILGVVGYLGDGYRGNVY